jgi:lipoprotein-anchoring transpeptidase ErfK/SrfK
MSSANENVTSSRRSRRSKKNNKNKKSVDAILNEMNENDKANDKANEENISEENISEENNFENDVISEENTNEENTEESMEEDMKDNTEENEDITTEEDEYDEESDEVTDAEDDTEEDVTDTEKEDVKPVPLKIERKKSSFNPAPFAAAMGVVAAVLVCITVAAGHFYFKDRWYLNTTLNEVPVSRQELNQTKKDFASTYADYSLTIKGRDDMVATVLKADIDLEVDADKYIDEVFEKQHDKFYLFALFSPQELEMKPDVSYSEDKLNELLNSSELVAGSADKPVVAPVNACAKFSDEKGYFAVIPEVEGNKLVPEEFDKAVEDALCLLLSDIDLTEYDGMFYAPEIREGDEGLQKTCDAYNSSVLHWINWKLSDTATVSLTPQDIMAWYDLGDDYSTTLDEQAVKDWVENFCLKYKSVGKTRKFKNHNGNVIDVAGGDYGWQLNYDATVNQVLDILKGDYSTQIAAYIADNSQENKNALVHNLDVSYKNKGYKFNAADITDDYNTSNYSEISISEQMVYVYQDGKCVYTAHCITGLPTPERETTKGTWYVKERRRDKTLVGETYETPVDYWVRITWSGIGYHDATWQNWGSWNASKYKTVGSHGCINLSMKDVAAIYDLVRVGDPVFIY